MRRQSVEVEDTGAPSRGAIGGSSNEAGSDFRSGVAAWVIAHGLLGKDLPNLQLEIGQAVPSMVALETDDPVDDIAVILSGGGKVCFQAKRSLNLGMKPNTEFMSVVRQWARAVADDQFNPSTDRLVLAVQSPSQTIRDLGNALNRRRAEISGAYTKRESEVLGKLVGVIGDLSNEHRDRLLRTAYILTLDLEEDGRGDAGTAEALLDGSVVAPEQGRRAWHELKRVASDLAQHREGRSIDGWMDALKQAGLSIIADAEKSTAGKREATRLAEDRYRQRVAARGSAIDLRGLGYPLAPLHAQEVLSRVWVTPGRNDEEAPRTRERKLNAMGAVRRRGRTVLLGLPGSGKSILLETAAAYWAGQPDWPLPLILDLRDFLRTMDWLSPLDNLIDVVTRDLDPQDRVLIGERVWEYAQNGMLTIFLDGLDETRERRVDMVRYIERLFQQVHLDCEVVVSTRDSGYSEAATLGFKELRLLPPEDMTGMLQLILDNLAGVDSRLREDERNQWVADRMSWVKDVLERDRHLTETPLMPILIALLAAQSDRSSLPRTRAQILSDVIDNLARQWEISERRQSDFQMGPLTGEEIPIALLDAFKCVGYLLISKSELAYQEAVEGITTTFQVRWGMPIGRAEAAAKESLSFWDEAGIIVATGPQAMLIARVRLFSEIAAARYLVDLTLAQQDEILPALLEEETSQEAAVLAAGLSTHMVNRLIEFATTQDSLEWAILAARSVDEGAAPTADALEKLVSLLMRRLRKDPQRAWEVAKSIVRLPVPDQQQEQVLAVFSECLTDVQSKIAEALATIHWGAPVLNLIGTALRGGPPKAGIVVDDGFNSLVELAAEQLLAGYPELAPDIAAGARQSSFGTSERVNQLLEKQGHGELVPDEVRGYGSVISKWLGGLDPWNQAWDRFLRLLASLGTPIDLTLGQKRRLDELANFLETLDMEDKPSDDVQSVLVGPAEPLKTILEAVTTLGGFEADTLATEALVVLAEQKNRSHFEMYRILFDDGNSVELTAWSTIDDIQGLQHRLIDLLGGPSIWLSVVAANALLWVPNRKQVVQHIDAKLSQLNPRNRDLAARVVTELNPTPQRVRDWISDPDSILRRVAARLQTRLFTKGSIPLEAVISTLADPDAGVREAVLVVLHGASLPDTLANLVREIVHDPGDTWMCQRCGETNIGSSRSCGSCRIVGPDPQKAATSLLMGIDQ